LFSAKANLLIPRLPAAGFVSFDDVFKNDLFFVWTPSVRKNRVRRYYVSLVELVSQPEIIGTEAL
jgi:hypothetical protein